MKNAKILLVDDNPDNIYLLEVILQARNYTTISARNGREAVGKVADDCNIDLILMDVMMPEMDGFEASRNIRTRKESAHIPIIMMTAKKRSLEDVVRGLDEGAVDYLSKPFDEEELLARVKSMLRIKSLYDDNRKLLDKVLKQQEVIEKELQVAQKVQLAMLPQTNLIDGEKIRIFPFYRSMVEVGGDFYDFMDYGPNRVAFFIADVSGHGPSAAMIVAMLKSLLLSEGGDFPSPSEILRRMNNKLTAIIPDEHFVTAFFCVADAQNGTLTYSRAGHPAPMLLGPPDGSPKNLEVGGMILGMFHKAEYQQATEKLSAGDKLFLYSDGIFEVQKNGEMFGLERLRSLVSASRKKGGGEIIEDVVKEIDAFWDGESTRDDMAALAVEFLQ